MRKRYLLFYSIAISIIFSACQKEVDFPPGQNPGNPNNPGNPGNPSAQSIIGEYDFVGLSAHTLAIVNVNAAGQQLRTVTVSDYNTINNTGTAKITANQIIATNMGYEVDTLMYGETFINGMSMGTIDMPFQVAISPTSSTSTYVKNSNDSITVTGTFGGAPNTSGSGPAGPTGLKYSWSGDTLLLRVSATVTQSISQGGVPGTLTGTVTGITRLKKKP